MKIKNEKGILPRVLVATPVSQRHGHLLDEWIAHLNALTYPVEICLVDTTPDTEEYFEILKTKTVQGKPIKVIRHEWDYKKFQAVQWMAFAREKIREYFLAEDFDYLMNLDDDIFLPTNGIQRLISYNKEQVGFYVHVYFEPDQVPCILKAGEIIMGKGLQYFSFAEIDAYKDFVKRMGEPNGITEYEKLLIPFLIKDPFHPQLFKPYAVNLGCLLVQRNVVETVPFRTHETFVMGEDLWYFNEANDKKFDFWCDSSIRCVHKNTEWDSVMKKGPPMNAGFSIMTGPADAQGIDVIDRSLDG